MADHGIDYGLGTTNRDSETGIRYGIVPMNALSQWAWDDMEADYGAPTCPKCGNDATEYDSAAQDEYGQDTHSAWPGYTDCGCCDFVCEGCEIILDSGDCYGEEPQGWTLDDGEYKGECDGIDLFVTLSPYYTHAQFCSPCAPGACYLLNPTDKDGARAYCLSHDWFEEGKAPYPVYAVATGKIVRPDRKSK